MRTGDELYALPLPSVEGVARVPRSEVQQHLVVHVVEMRAGGHWIMQFHAGPMGHAYIDDPAFSTCHRYYPCRYGQDDATYEARVKSDVAQGLGAMRSIFDLPDHWHGSTFAVPWDDAGSSETAGSWVSAYLADQFPVVFVQDSYTGDVDNQRYRFEIHNPFDLDRFESGLESPNFARPDPHSFSAAGF